MEPDVSKLDEFLADRGVDGYLLNADGEDSDQRYLSGFGAPDPYTTAYADGEVHLLVSSLEFGRARDESRAETVRRLADYDYRGLVEEYDRREATVRVVADWLADLDVESVAVPWRFPVGVADGLRDRDVAVDARDGSGVGVVTEIRARKTDEEIDHVRGAQRANERAMARAETVLAEATVEDGRLHHDGEVLTSERVKEAIEIALLENGCALDETIVACGADGADPHNRGSGPLDAGEPIVIDIFPRDKATGYHADMTRTFLQGDPDDRVRERYEVTAEAMDAAFAALEQPAVTGAAVHDAVCDVYEDAGYETLRGDPSAETGFIHSTGHGVGLDVHEAPSVGPSGGRLEPGHVITIEPGLYDPAVGGIRIEDLVVVTEDGYENLTDYPRKLVVD
jgi:Xaa-Pro aminopeptidase